MGSGTIFLGSVGCGGVSEMSGWVGGGTDRWMAFPCLDGDEGADGGGHPVWRFDVTIVGLLIDMLKGSLG